MSSDDQYPPTAYDDAGDDSLAQGYAAERSPDDYSDIDDEYPEPGVPGGYVGDAETLLRRAIDIVATAPTMPLSSSPRIDRDEIIELLQVGCSFWRRQLHVPRKRSRPPEAHPISIWGGG